MDDLLLDPLRLQHDRAPQALSRTRAAALAAAASLALAGCAGGEDDSETAGAAAGAGEGGAISWALPERPETVDPLSAASPGEALISRQVHEPLAETVAAPFDESRRLPGLAVAVLPNDDATVWRVRLRSGVGFQDGGSFNNAAVLANASRWQDSAAARRLLGSFLVDAPKPGLVRFILPAPDPGFARGLASARLGIVSPRALRRAGSGGPLSPAATRTGTGPFEIRERSSDRLLLARNTAWWGSDRELGPALDQLEFLFVPDPAERAALLVEERAEVASGLGAQELRRIGRDPLLAVIDPSAGLAAERSVRGLTGAEDRVPMLNDVWLTEIAPG